MSLSNTWTRTVTSVRVSLLLLISIADTAMSGLCIANDVLSCLLALHPDLDKQMHPQQYTDDHILLTEHH